MYRAYNEKKRKKRETVEGIGLSNQKNIKILNKKENYKFLEILEAEMIKQLEIKEKVRKAQVKKKKTETFSKPNSTVEISLRE